MRDLPVVASAYLRTHVDNPVDWWTWGADAFAEATRRNVPVFLSVGYAACHWCHVMAHESFEHPGVAEFLNEHFVAIKVDREERPDVDQLYMAATQLISGHGGWPMSVFLTPDRKPFTAGTYYPPTDRGGQVGFGRLLEAINDAWHHRHDDVLTQTATVEAALAREVSFVDFVAPATTPLDLTNVDHLLGSELESQTDADGGHGSPRFPRPSYVLALLRTGHLEAAERALRAMAFEGLYDHIEGGFARYSVDSRWHVPHFEQMLSDQALLAIAYFEAGRYLPEGPWHEVARATLSRLVDAFALPSGFASSLDADAGGHEGSHVTWTVEEVTAALTAAGCPDLVEAACDRWRIVTPGLFEDRSIPRLAKGQPFTTPAELEPARKALRAVRAQRPQPQRDEKVVLEWNAMVASAMFASRDVTFTTRALDLLDSLAVTHHVDGAWYRTEQRTIPAMATDVAWWATACLDAFETTGDDRWLERAHQANEYLLANFWDGDRPTPQHPHEGRGLFSTCAPEGDVFLRPKELFDGATPSSHAVATRAFARYALAAGDTGALVVAQRLVTMAQELLTTHPRAVVDLVEAATFAFNGVEIVVPGPPNELLDYVRRQPLVGAVVVHGSGTSPLLTGRQAGLAYVCRNNVCRQPVATTADLDQAIGAVR